jgi:hypothetical protein
MMKLPGMDAENCKEQSEQFEATMKLVGSAAFSDSVTTFC